MIRYPFSALKPHKLRKNLYTPRLISQPISKLHFFSTNTNPPPQGTITLDQSEDVEKIFDKNFDRNETIRKMLEIPEMIDIDAPQNQFHGS